MGKKPKLKPDEFNCLGKTHKMPLFVPSMPNDVYHGKGLKDFIGHSGVVQLVHRTPAHFQAYQDDESPPTPAMEFGSAAHIFMLEDPKDRVVWCDLKDRDGRYLSRGSATTAKWAAKMIEEEGAEYAVLHHEWRKLEAMKKVLYKHPIARNLIIQGKPELSGFFIHERYQGIKCKIRVDFEIDDGSLFAFIDYKTCRDASPEGFGKAAYDYGYDIQAALYREGGKIIKGRWPHFFFIAQEKDPPYAVAVYVANNFEDPEKTTVFTDLGMKRLNKGLELYWKCIINPHLFNDAYPPRTLPIFPPSWALKEWKL